jgi:hypothetical protein
LPNDRLGNESFAEDESLMSPFQAFFENGARPTRDHAYHHPTLVVEVGHNHNELEHR